MKLHTITGQPVARVAKAISAVTGLPTDESAALLRAVTGKKAIRDLHVRPEEVVSVMELVGWECEATIHNPNDQQTLKQWLDTHDTFADTYIVVNQTTNSYFAVGNNEATHIYDTHCSWRKPLCVSKAQDMQKPVYATLACRPAPTSLRIKALGQLVTDLSNASHNHDALAESTELDEWERTKMRQASTRYRKRAREYNQRIVALGGEPVPIDRRI